jgi:hypothetical protein
MAITGLPNSFSFVPVARQSARAPAMFLPSIVASERSFMLGKIESFANKFAKNPRLLIEFESLLWDS